MSQATPPGPPEDGGGPLAEDAGEAVAPVGTDGEPPEPGIAEAPAPPPDSAAEATAPAVSVPVDPTEVQLGAPDDSGAPRPDETMELDPDAILPEHTPTSAELHDTLDPDAILPEHTPTSAELHDTLGVARPADQADAEPLEDAEAGRTRRGGVLLAALASVVLVAVLVVLGRHNAERHLLTCETAQVVAQRGRGFPPWGASALEGPEWKPVSIPLAAECLDRETRSEDEFVSWYLNLLIEQATARLTARKIVDVDVATAQLEQALLFARAPERRDQRREIERLLGDVEYWRAVDKLRTASEAMAEAAKQFEEAAVKQPRHVGDAAARAVLIRRLLQELGGQAAALQKEQANEGPAAAPSPLEPLEPPPEPTLPVSPSAPDVPLAPALGEEPAPPVSAPDASATEEPAPVIDAGPPSGGVLL
ncbi:MAG: hypothetical protein R3B48_10785 [Kofleriaceae bacterium]